MESKRIVLFVDGPAYLENTIKSIVVNSDAEIIIYNTNNIDIPIGPYTVISGSKIAMHEVINDIANTGDISHLILLRSPVKVEYGWLDELCKNDVSIPITHALDADKWKLLPSYTSLYGFKWSGDIKPKHDAYITSKYTTYSGDSHTPFVTMNGLCVSKKVINAIGGFDADTAFELDLSFNLLYNDIPVTVANTKIGCNLFNNVMRNDMMYVAEKYLDSDLINTIYNKLAIPKSDYFHRYSGEKKNVRSKLAGWQPELFGLNRMVSNASGKSVAVLCDGPSLDDVPTSFVYSHDVIIGVNDTGLLYDCDYVVCDNLVVYQELLAKYNPSMILMPSYLYGANGSSVIRTSSKAPHVQQFEFDSPNKISDVCDSPICNCNSLNVAAVHIAMVLKPKSCFIYGADFQHVGGKSHTSKVDRYNGGMYFSESDNYREMFKYHSYMINRIASEARKLGIQTMKVNYA